ncbi:MAG TPA: hemerythrin domain-containing protein [Chitinophagaceae bacterium]|nr:hemerythrin domain-containing protein [Chitinophagaceae bacterium]
MKKSMQQELKSLSAVELMNFVSDKYHASEKRNLSSLNQCFQFMPPQDIKNYPELATIRVHFGEIRKLLQKHLTDSETVYFPAIRKNTDTPSNLSHLQDQVHSIKEDISKRFSEIRTLTHHYNPPLGASAWMKLCYALLHDLESDTNHHLFVEESILPVKLGA